MSTSLSKPAETVHCLQYMFYVKYNTCKDTNLCPMSTNSVKIQINYLAKMKQLKHIPSTQLQKDRLGRIQTRLTQS